MTIYSEFLTKQFEAWDVGTVFGTPGVYIVELYRGLPGSHIHHATPRREQGAGLMVDGYAQITGKPGMYFIIAGPRTANILTAMVQAYADSIPTLMISSVSERAHLAYDNNYLHELPNQHNLVGNVCVFGHTLMSAEGLPAVLARAFTVFDSERSRPIHIEPSLDVTIAPTEHLALRPRIVASRSAPALAPLRETATRLRNAKKPLLLLGGGYAEAAIEARAPAVTLDTPTALTINAKGLLPADHPLLPGGSRSCVPIYELAVEADVVLTIGTGLGETDYDVVFDGGFALDGELIRISIDPQ